MKTQRVKSILSKTGWINIYVETCKYCDEDFTSLNKNQLTYNFGEHIKSHERKKDKIRVVEE